MKELAKANYLYKEFEKSLKKLINDYIMTSAQNILNPGPINEQTNSPKSRGLTPKPNN